MTINEEEGKLIIFLEGRIDAVNAEQTELCKALGYYYQTLL